MLEEKSDVKMEENMSRDVKMEENMSQAILLEVLTSSYLKPLVMILAHRKREG